MRRAFVCLVVLAAFGCQQQKSESSTSPTTTSAAAGNAANPTTEDQKTLYALGMSMGRSIAVFDLSPEELAYVKAGIDAQVLNQKPAVQLEQYGPKIQELARSRSKARAEKEKEKSKGFLEQAEKEPNAEKLPSGVIYVPEKEGTGAQPDPTDTVKVNYRGTLTDGTEFDSSYKRNEPATFRLNQVIPCWTQGVAKMKVGGKAKLVCPSDTAYGERGAGAKIPGGATLVFEVELLDAQKTPAQPQMGMPQMHPQIQMHPQAQPMQPKAQPQPVKPGTTK